MKCSLEKYNKHSSCSWCVCYHPPSLGGAAGWYTIKKWYVLLVCFRRGSFFCYWQGCGSKQFFVELLFEFFTIIYRIHKKPFSLQYILHISKILVLKKDNKGNLSSVTCLRIPTLILKTICGACPFGQSKSTTIKTKFCTWFQLLFENY